MTLSVIRRSIILALSALIFSILVEMVAADIHTQRLRCEYLVNPLGIDVEKPRLGWIVASTSADRRGLRQTAYRIIVASTPEKLAADEGDLWDSGRVENDETIHIEYAGKPLQSRMQCHWKVCVWDEKGCCSAWSEPASWSMGLLNASDWNAQWIAHHDPSQPAVIPPRHGYLTWLGKSPDAAKWVAVDLGEELKIDGVRLYPACPDGETPGALGFRPYGWQPGFPGFLFPVRFKIEAARKADFSDAKTVVDCTADDVHNPGSEVQVYRFEPISARHVRLTVTRLADRQEGNFGFALAEMQVFSGTKNVAENVQVTALESVETGGWSKDNLVDGRLRSENGNRGDFSSRSAVMVRKEFDAPGPIRRAVVSVTGLGLYELRINGRRVGDRLLAPEWTRYCKRIQYQTYDVTDLMREGRNAVAAQMCGGWWTGPLAIESPLINPQFCLLMRLDIELADGSTQTIVTDPSWQSSDDGPIRRAGIYFGEAYDARKEMPGWDRPGFAAAGWTPVQILPHPDGAEKAVLVAQSNEPIRVVKELKPVKVTEPKPGVYVFDMGQNMVGCCRLTADAPAGVKITLRHAEMLNPDGTIYTDNLRNAAQVNEYIWRGGEAVMEPHFTYYGFRYVEITGLAQRPDENMIVGRVFHSSAPDAGTFSCSNELINKIMHCVEWVERGNLMSVPTDCPQRTERFGFTGDIQAFSQTAIFTLDLAGFFTKWMRDVRDSQLDDGRLPNLAPHPAPSEWLDWTEVEFASGWSDAGTIIPWRVYENYADKRMLRQSFDSAKQWVDFVHANNPNLLWRNNRGGDYGDWLSGDMTALADYPRGISETPKEVLATAFFAHSSEILSKMAKVLGYDADAAKYAKLSGDINAAFNKAYVDADGRIKGDTQAGYALALSFDLLDGPKREKAVGHLLEAIKKYKSHPSTGIQTTHRMMLELTRNGRHGEAWRLINLRSAPSWGYMIDQGATTIWERWDGYVEGRGFQSSNMNSFNHWAFGAVGEWVWRNIAGINPDENSPGYKHFFIRPRPSEGLTWAKARYNSIHGPITSEWKQTDGRVILHVEIPANATATVYMPTQDAESVSEDNRPAAEAAGVKFIRKESNTTVYAVDSGRYDFAADYLP